MNTYGRRKLARTGMRHQLFILHGHTLIQLNYSRFPFLSSTLTSKRCVVADSSRTHSVCECAIHQNTILLIDAPDIPDAYKRSMSRLVLSCENHECMIHRCEKCPGDNNLKGYLTTIVKEKYEQVLLFI